MTFVSSLMFKFVKCELKKLSNTFHTDGKVKILDVSILKVSFKKCKAFKKYSHSVMYPEHLGDQWYNGLST